MHNYTVWQKMISTVTVVCGFNVKIFLPRTEEEILFVVRFEKSGWDLTTTEREGGGERGRNQVEFGPFYGRSIAVIRLTLHTCHLLGLLRKRTDNSESTYEQIGMFGIKIGKFALQESIPLRYFAQASQKGLFRTESRSTNVQYINVCFHIVIAWILLLFAYSSTTILTTCCKIWL